MRCLYWSRLTQKKTRPRKGQILCLIDSDLSISTVKYLSLFTAHILPIPLTNLPYATDTILVFLSLQLCSYLLVSQVSLLLVKNLLTSILTSILRSFSDEHASEEGYPSGSVMLIKCVFLLCKTTSRLDGLRELFLVFCKSLERLNSVLWFSIFSLHRFKKQGRNLSADHAHKNCRTPPTLKEKTLGQAWPSFLHRKHNMNV